MKKLTIILVLSFAVALSSCGKKDAGESSQAGQEAAAPAQPAATGPHVSVQLQDGSKVPGTIVASTKTDMTVVGDDGIERKIPLEKVKSVDYTADTKPEQSAKQAVPAAAPERRAPAERPAPRSAQVQPEPRPSAPVLTAKTYELPAGSEVSIRTNEAINSATASEGQSFDADVTRDVSDVAGEVVIPRGSPARVVIRSASKGGRFRGASDLVLDLQSVSIRGNRYLVDTAVVEQKGKSGIGANKRTATFTGGGAAVGAIIGAIAGGGKGAAIGAGAGAGAGALTQIITKGGSIKVPAETVLTFRLDKPLTVNAAE